MRYEVYEVQSRVITCSCTEFKIVKLFVASQRAWIRDEYIILEYRLITSSLTQTEAEILRIGDVTGLLDQGTHLVCARISPLFLQAQTATA